METLANQIEDTTEKKELLLNPPKLEKPLETLYKTIKRLQKYCITINTQADIPWKNFMEVYRFSLDAPQDNILEELLSRKNQQLQLREFTAEYLDTISPMMLQIFEEIQNFSQTFSSCYEDLQRGIEDTIKGSPDKDYAVVIEYLVNEIKQNQTKNKDREEKLTIFSKKLELTYVALSVLKVQTEFFFDDQREEIKQLEKELHDLEAREDKNNASAIETSYQTKKPLSFSLSETNDSQIKDSNKNSDEVEKNKKNLKDKIKILQQQLAEYDSDYANLNSIVKACSQFRSGLFSLKKDVVQTKHTWHSLTTFLTLIEKILADVNTEKEWITNSLIPSLRLLNDYFIALDKTITDIKKILPMEITGVEKTAQGFLTGTSEKVPNSSLLNFYIKKMASK